MTLATTIASLRKQNNITQEALAQKLGVTNQAVSKWESDQCCPDVTLLPKLADIFQVTIDELFGRPAPKLQKLQLPWADDDTLHVVAFVGRQLVEEHPAAKDIRIHYSGDVGNVSSAFSVQCGDVDGNINAGSGVSCGDVDGHIQAGGNVTCGDIGGDLKAGGNVHCGDIDGDATIGGIASCGDIGGNICSGRETMTKRWKEHFPAAEE